MHCYDTAGGLCPGGRGEAGGVRAQAGPGRAGRQGEPDPGLHQQEDSAR